MRSSRHCLTLALLTSLATIFAFAGDAPFVVAPFSISTGGSFQVLVGGAADVGGLQVRLVSNSRSAPPVAVTNAEGSNFLQLSLAVPATTTSGSYSLELLKSSTGEKLSTKPVEVVVGAELAAAAVIVETDKPVYKPGQTVNMRVISFSPSFMPKAGTATVTIKDPRSFAVGRWVEELDAYGVGKLQFPTSTEPMLGRWTVEAVVEAEGAKTTSSAAFTIDRYVLPTFEVNVLPDSVTVYNGQSSVEGRLECRYTYGEPLQGTFVLNLWQATVGFGSGMFPMEGVKVSPTQAEGRQYTLVASLGEQELMRSASSTRFTLDVSNAKMNFGYGYGAAPELVLEAVVTDGATGATQNGSAALTPAYHLYKLELSGPLAAKPGLGMALTLKASRHDGSPLIATFPFVKSVYHMNGASKTTRFDVTTTTQGSRSAMVATAGFTIEIPADDPSCCLETDRSEYRSGSCCITSVSVNNDRTAAGALSAEPEAAAAVGVGRTYSSSSSSSSSLVPSVSWYGNVGLSTVHGAYISVVPPVQSPNTPGESSSFTVTSTFKPPAGNFNWAVLAGTAGVLASGKTTPASLSSKDAWQCFAVVNITKAMSPSAIMLVFTPWDGKGGESTNLVAAQVSFMVESDQLLSLPQSVTVAVNKGEVRPGASVAVDAKASVPGSRVFFLAYDVSVALQAGGSASALTPERVLGVIAPEKAGHQNPTLHCYPPADFDGSKIVVLTLLKTASCVAQEPVMADAVMENMMQPAKSSSPRSDVENGGGLASVTRVRSFFPETWVWMDAQSDAVTGVATLSDLKAPDTITSWRFSAFATHPTGGIGVAHPTAASSLLRVFKPFFVSPNLPFSVIRGESLVLRVGVFNYLDVELAVVVNLQESPADYDVIGAGGTSKTVTVAKKGTNTAVFTLRLKRLGNVIVHVSGRTGVEVGYADAVRKVVIVEPEGFPQEKVFNAIVNRGASTAAGSEIVKIAPPLPSSGIVEGSIRSLLSVVGDLMGPSIKGLEQLVRVPTGCGEQNMIGMAPNVYVLVYLKQTRQLTDVISSRATSNIIRGYQRELQYRHSNGAFSAFGEHSGAGGLGGQQGTNAGSLWLTAFVIRVFVQSADVATGLYVDPNVLSTAAAFVASNQALDGSFTDPSPPLHSEMAGGAGKGPGLTAYCLLAMIEAGRSAGNVEASISYLANAVESKFGGSSFVAAIVAHALTASCAKVNKGCDAARRAQRAMLAMGVTDEDGTMHWGTSPALRQSSSRVAEVGRTSSTEVEGTAYAVLALVHGGDLSSAYPGARYLLFQRNARGGFRSTQDTVVALEALGAYAAATYSRDTSLSVALDNLAATTGGKTPDIITVNNGNFDLLQQIDVSPVTELNVAVSGTGIALLQLAVSYNLVEDPDPPAYSLTVVVRATKIATGAVGGGRRRRSLSSAPTVSADDARSLDVEACVRGREDGPALGMSLLEIGIFTGFTPKDASLDDLRVKGVGLINRLDVDDRKVVLYMEEISAAYTTCITMQIVQEYEVKNLKPALSTVSSYYHPEAKGSFTTKSTEIEVVEGSAHNRDGGSVTIDGNTYVPGAGAPPPSVVDSSAQSTDSLAALSVWLSFIVSQAIVRALNTY